MKSVARILASLSAVVLCARSEAANYVTRIDSTAVFESVTIPEDFRPDLVRMGKYLAPATADTLSLPVVFQDVHVYPRHLEFMAQEFPDRFPSLTLEEYQALVELRATRQYWAGAILQIEPSEGSCRFGFTVFTAPGRSDELLAVEEVSSVLAALATSFTVGTLCYVPDTAAAQDRARTWDDPPFPIYYLGPDDTVVYEAYTTGTTFGRVRLMTAEEAERASAAGTLSWQDIVVIDGVPAFLESVVAGIVTEARQGELSHLNVRAARRGTPNVYIKAGQEAFRSFEGKLVRAVFGAATYESPVVATEADAEAWWQEHRPKVDPPPAPDTAWQELTDLGSMGDDRIELVTQFGAKAANLSVMNRCLPPDRRLPGFAIPFHWYEQFIERNIILDRRASPPRPVSFQAYIQSLLADQKFRSDSAYRAMLLAGIRREIEDNSVIDPELVEALAARIEEVFGSRGRMVRFRSSSNTEDGLEFNGAGLYDSFSVCALDSFDGGGGGPSLCNPREPSERTIERGLRRVWASLWNSRAFEEREYYQVPHAAASMAILVTPAFPDEASNGVAFTGSPLDAADKRYLINVQQGDESVVNPDPTVFPEKDILELEGGAVTRIVRARPSSLVPPGAYVLTEDQLRRLGSALYEVERCFPIDPGDFPPDRVILDFEFKFLASGELVLKQVRPFLIPEPLLPPGPTFRLVIPPSTTCMGVFRIERTLDIEQGLLSYGAFRSGTHELPSNRTSFPGDLIESLAVGAPDARAEPLGAGQFSLAVSTGGDYTYTYSQRFAVGTAEYILTIEGLTFRDAPGRREIVFDDWYLSRANDPLRPGDFLNGLRMKAAPADEPASYERTIAFGGDDLRALPLYRIEVTSGQERIELDYHLVRIQRASGPANLVSGRLALAEGSREVNDYWHLVYSAGLHNLFQRFRVRLDPPLGAVHAVDVHEPDPFGHIPPAVILRDHAMGIIRQWTIDTYEERLIVDPRLRPFVRGDVNADGRTNVTDAVRLLRAIFSDEAPPPPCRDALDANDSGAIDIADAIRLLGYLFANGTLAAPRGACGVDPTPNDALKCESFAPCPE